MTGYLLGLNEQGLELEPILLGPLFESFVIMEIRKQTAWSRVRPQAFHFRTQAGQEVDLVLEDAAGNLVHLFPRRPLCQNGPRRQGFASPRLSARP